jgi:hypothetical protein
MARPREHDRNKIAQDMLEWAKQDDSINLCKFCALNSIVPSKISQWAKEDDSFRQAYELTKAYLGYRREEKLNLDELHVKAYDLNATTYDYFLKDERRQQAEFESELKAKTDNNVTENDVIRFDAMMKQLAIAQSVSSDRMIADSNIISEQ